MSRILTKTRSATVKLTPEQYKLVEQRAEKCQMSVSAWMRSILAQAAYRPANNGHITIREPDGATT
jgi:hypothetical protein